MLEGVEWLVCLRGAMAEPNSAVHHACHTCWGAFDAELHRQCCESVSCSAGGDKQPHTWAMVGTMVHSHSPITCWPRSRSSPQGLAGAELGARGSLPAGPGGVAAAGGAGWLPWPQSLTAPWRCPSSGLGWACRVMWDCWGPRLETVWLLVCDVVCSWAEGFRF